MNKADTVKSYPNLATSSKFKLTCRFFASGLILMPALQPFEEFPGVALVSLLTNDLLHTRRLVLVNPQ